MENEVEGGTLALELALLRELEEDELGGTELDDGAAELALALALAELALALALTEDDTLALALDEEDDALALLAEGEADEDDEDDEDGGGGALEDGGATELTLEGTGGADETDGAADDEGTAIDEMDEDIVQRYAWGAVNE